MHSSLFSLAFLAGAGFTAAASSSGASTTTHAPSTTSAAGGTTSAPAGGNAGACASVAKLAASQTSAGIAAPTFAAELAYNCLTSIPFNSSAATLFLNSIDPYLEWQTNLEYIAQPPAVYAQKVQAPYDFYATWNAIKAKTKANGYANEYEFGFDVYKVCQRAHDGHFALLPDSAGLLFGWGRQFTLISVSSDGKSVPQPYVVEDIMAANNGSAGFKPSPIVQINGQKATDFLLALSQEGNAQDPDALYNNLFYNPAQVALGADGTAGGIFSGGGRGRYVYPGPKTTLKFANGTTVSKLNYAQLQVPLDNITSGSDVYKKYFIPPADAYKNVFQLYAESKLSLPTAPTNTPPSSPTPNPGYPSPVVRHSQNLNSGYFLSGAGYDDVAVLAVNSFVGGDEDIEKEFQNVNSELIAAAQKAGKKKLIIDVSANGGGTILQGYDLFKQLFPSILPYGATRFRAHEAFGLLGIEASYEAGLWPRKLTGENETQEDISSSVFNYRTDADINYKPFKSWGDKFGPHAYGPKPDNFSSIIRWNLSDVLTPLNSGGIYVSGYLNRSNVTVQPFKAEDIIIIYDGYCASTCTIFSELMRQQAGVRTISLGGRPNLDLTQAVGGVKGTNDFSYQLIFYAIGESYVVGNASARAYFKNSVLNNYTQLPLIRSLDSFMNVRDGLRQGDKNQLPLQFYYEPADCRVLYTAASALSETALWKTIADTTWNGKSSCVAGSLNGGTYPVGGGSARSLETVPFSHAAADDTSLEEYLESLKLRTDGTNRRGDGFVKP